MKRLLLSCLLIFTIFQLIAAQDSVSAMNSDSIKIAGNSSISENKVSVSGEAIAAYNDGNFRKVIEILEVEKKAKLTEGVESSEL